MLKRVRTVKKNIRRFIDRNFFSGVEKKTTDVKAEVDMNLADEITMRKIIPANIVIGPFLVHTESVRKGLSTKRNTLAYGVLDKLAERVSAQAEAVSVFL